MDRNTLKLGLFLMLVAGIAALALSSVNSITRPIIAANEQAAVEAALLEVYPEGDALQEQTGEYREMLPEELTGLHLVLRENRPAGIIYLIEVPGYADTIRIAAGFDLEERILTGIRVLYQAETPGLGANIVRPDYLEQFEGQPAGDDPLLLVQRPPAAPGEIQSVTAATVSARALVDGVNLAAAHFRANF